MKLLLISENEDDWDVLRNITKFAFPNIEFICANGPEQAMSEASTNGPFALYLLDYDMKEIDANALGLNLIEFTGERPILFLGTEQVFNDRISMELFNSNQYNEPIFRPISRDDFSGEYQEKLKSALLWAKQEEFAENVIEINPDDYIKIKLKSFYLYNEFAYDIYMSVTSTCYIKLITKNKSYSHSTLSQYARKNVKYLYIKKDDHLKYLETEATKCYKALKEIKADHKDIYLVMLQTLTICLDYLNTLGYTDAIFKLLDQLTSKIIEHSDKTRSLKKILKKFPTYYQGIASKSLLTGFISYFLGTKVGWEAISTKRKVVIGSLIHELSLEDDFQSSIPYTFSPEFQLISDELQQNYHDHPGKAAGIAKQFTSYPELDHLIENHHELPSRKGFPHRPSLSKFTQLNAVFNISQFIATQIDGEEVNAALLNKVLKGMTKDFSTGVFKETLKIAQKILK